MGIFNISTTASFVMVGRIGHLIHSKYFQYDLDCIHLPNLPLTLSLALLVHSRNSKFDIRLAKFVQVVEQVWQILHKLSMLRKMHLSKYASEFTAMHFFEYSSSLFQNTQKYDILANGPKAVSNQQRYWLSNLRRRKNNITVRFCMSYVALHHYKQDLEDNI